MCREVNVWCTACDPPSLSSSLMLRWSLAVLLPLLCAASATFPRCAESEAEQEALRASSSPPTCEPPPPGDAWKTRWAAAAAAPTLCPGSVVHGFLHLSALASALSRSPCYSNCLFLGSDLPAPPVGPLGWTLGHTGQCWRELHAADGCIAEWSSRSRADPPLVDCSRPRVAMTCDLILSPEEHPARAVRREKPCGIPVGELLGTPSHTHAGTRAG